MTNNEHLITLKQMVPPPSEPAFASGDWSAVEEQLRVELPNDFKQLIETYGTGVFNGQLAIYSPFASGDSGLLYRIDIFLHNFNSYREDNIGNWVQSNLSIFPEPEGLLPFAYVENGPILSWQTVGTPDQWPIFVWFNDDIKMYDTEYRSLTHFIVDLLQQKASLVPIFAPGSYKPAFGPPWRFVPRDCHRAN